MGPELSKTWYLGRNLKKFGFCWCNFEHLYFILFLNSIRLPSFMTCLWFFMCDMVVSTNLGVCSSFHEQTPRLITESEIGCVHECGRDSMCL